ncbi:ATP-binding protein [Methanoregula sp. PtaB.Bin085]|uniref:ATP-binding protein n=1 Tax=Methanoregula sp. PtaB.Bin085 TaxID=1811680 RepID=UPI0009C4A50C|nr:DUF499 domain-containing protein [Methanoregula sp. PtaB.Bin085]OPX61890.1 MAG: hypothetical protein A4E33_02487 [Methanoregula sp. PtaB.Bin085]
MKAFHTVAVPHKDILDGRLTMDVFAADLWEVSKNRGPDEYRDAKRFFEHTYRTEGLSNLLDVVQKRLEGKGGDPVIQIQTPFGGGKTHTLIALYHNAKIWDSKTIVIVGTALSTDTTLWGALEQQLTGKITKCKGQTAPGREVLRDLLDSHQPVLILMDEVLEYVTKAAGVKVGDSTLASQSIAFMQELSECAGICEKVCLAVTLPASILEHYDEKAETLYQQLQKVSGRVEKIYTPVEEHEITMIIRRRLFSTIDDKYAKKVVKEFMDYADKEGILPAGVQPSEYRDRFVASYPFMPEVIDVLYHKWGSFPTFQRTRGVLRLLSLVIYAIKGLNKPYISLADFDLSNQEIRQELLKHIGAEYNSVLAADITDAHAGAKLVDSQIGNAYQGFQLGRRTATTIFMYSFSGGAERGTTVGEIKRSATTMDNPSSVIVVAVDLLKGKLFYLQNIGDKYYFKNQPNINRIILSKIDNIKESEIVEAEKENLKANLKGGKFRISLWTENSADIPDTDELKLVILRKENKKTIEDIIKNKGGTPRVYRNTLFFLCPLESERPVYLQTLSRSIAYAQVEGDKELGISEEQRREISKEHKKFQDTVKECVQRLYRIVWVPGKEPSDLGIPTFGENRGLDAKIFDDLRTAGEILERTTPLFLKTKYLSKNEFVSTEQIYQSTLKTPGEPRFVNKSILENAISEGVQNGIFGLGILENNTPKCEYFRKTPSVSLSANEVIIVEGLCREAREEPPADVWKDTGSRGEGATGGATVKGGKESGESQTSLTDMKNLRLSFTIPMGKVSNILGVINFLTNRFKNVDIIINAQDGSLSEQDYENKIKEAFEQIGVELREE